MRHPYSHYILMVAILGLFFNASAAIVSNSGEELEYEYELTFKSHQQVRLSKADAKIQAAWHASHVDGLFHSASYAAKYDVSTDLSEGYAGSQHPEVIVIDSELRKDGFVWITYRARARALVLKTVVVGWIGTKKQGAVELPMLLDMTGVYESDMENYADEAWEKCTDAHYQGPIDFYYFYDPFRCPALGLPPIGGLVTFKITRVNNTAATKKAIVPKAEIHGANGNGKLVTLYFISGFDDLGVGSSFADIKKDFGWASYASLDQFLVAQDFIKVVSLSHFRNLLGEDIKNIELLIDDVTLEHPGQRRFVSTYVKSVGDITYVVRSALFPTENKQTNDPLVSFPKFWKEAWENGDFIYYNGHSGSGHHLSLDVMLRNLSLHDIGAINFKKQKTQIVFLDSCSSYAHFLPIYSSQKSRNLHLMSYGLVSLFHLAPASVETMITLLTSELSKEIKWLDALRQIEQAQLRPHVELLWQKKDVEEVVNYFTEVKQYPALLLNVWIED